MWGKSKASSRKPSSGHFDTLISSKTQLEGDLHFSGGLHIDGKVKGTIRADDNSEAIIRISDVGEVDGDVIAPHIIVNGTVHGDVYSSKHIELAANASIKGNVYYHLIEMVMGAEVNGNLVHHKEPVPVEKVKQEKLEKNVQQDKVGHSAKEKPQEAAIASAKDEHLPAS